MVIEGKQVKEWVERAYNNAVKHGWYEEEEAYGTLGYDD